MKRGAVAFLLALALVWSSALLAAAADSQRAGWELITRYRFNEAEIFFRQLLARDPSRENRYALAVALLNRQPKTDATLEESSRLLRSVTADSRSAANDEVALAARYYLARILQLHQAKPDWAAAKLAYRDLSSIEKGGFWADAAAMKWATLHVYESTPWSEKGKRLAEAETMLKHVSDPTLTKDFHIILADGYEKFGVSEARALAHLEAAWALGIERGIDQGDFLARMGELARRTGDLDKARGYFAEFLRRFRRDERVYWIKRKLADLSQGGGS